MPDFSRIGHFLLIYPLLNVKITPAPQIQIIILLIGQFIKQKTRFFVLIPITLII